MNPRSLLNQLLYPYEAFTALRETYGPVSYNQDGKFWEVFGYDNVLMLTSDPETFSSDGSPFVERAESWEEDKTILNLDPPRHRQLRSLVTQAFTPRALARMTARIAAITNDLLDQTIQRGEMDLIADFSYPLPVIVISEMLGVPSEDRARFKKWSDDMVISEYEDVTRDNLAAYNARMQAVVRRTLDELYDYFRVILAQRRVLPRVDLISDLLAAQIDGQSLTEQEILSFCALLLIAGNITTTNLIGNTMLCFDENPDTLERIQAQPDLLPQAIEEILRYRAPAILIGRYTTRNVTINEHIIPRGQMIIGWTASANFDPEQFPQPERFDIERTPNRHLAFGHGIHFCLGAPLARLEAKIALEILLERTQHLRRNHNQPIETVHSTFILGPRRLPVVFTGR
ncbi:cytochrome P450 [Dictyobacter arantiisoli]|uniref:Putative cytochrome P450 YjiB n=1 Tax=Dictyobacter arantiisoli TaxID=2014874 RepID=A0A5A5TH90_9CHLR|nr:cytochrome P450 [Dictyobacter arantiisoli]GCF10578.1 putative cytochrome P450 YjiB [Dictyobacter arantiisoli]